MQSGIIIIIIIRFVKRQNVKRLPWRNPVDELENEICVSYNDTKYYILFVIVLFSLLTKNNAYQLKDHKK